MQILGLAIAYFSTGKLGTFLAIPPGYATAIWPPSGIALAGILLFGYRAWPGILLGSIFVNFSTTIAGGNPSEIIISVMTAVGIGSGAALQALIGAYMVKRFAGFPNQLANVKEVFSFMLFGGLFSSLVNSTIAVTTLIATDRVPLVNALSNWLTWWTGDVIGILIFTPLVLVWTLRPTEHWRGRHLPITLTILTAFMLTLALVVYITQKEKEHLRLEFERDSTAMKVALEKSLLTHLRVLHSLESFFVASEKVDQLGFKAFVAHSLDDLHGIQALAWDPIIPSVERKAYELSMQRSGISNFNITERNRLRQLINAGIRSEYVPIRFIEPYKGNESALGYDVYSDVIRKEAINRARDTGEVATTARITLVQESSNQFGILAFTPIYRKDLPTSTTEERQHNISGYAVAVFRGGDIITSALKYVNQNNLSYRLFDESAPTGPQLLYANDVKDQKLIALREEGLFGGNVNLVSNSIIPIGGRQWRFEVTPTQSYIAAHRTDSTWLILLAGLLLTSMLSAFVMILSGRGNVLRKLVEDSTSELQAGNDELKNMTEKLHMLNERLQLQSAALDASANAIVITDSDAVIEWANPAFAKMTGYDLGEIIGRRPKNLVKSGKQDQSFYEKLWQTIITGKSWHGELINQRKDGSLYDEEMTITPMLDDNNVATHFVAVKQDITARKQLEASVYANSLYSRSLIEASLDPLLTISLEGKITDVNIATEQVTGVDKVHLVGTEFADYFTDPQKAREGYEQALLKGSVSNYELAIRHASGKITDVLYNASLYHDENGRVLGVFAAARDVTERKQIEALFLGLFEQSSFLAGTLDQQGNLVNVNNTAINLIGASRDDVIGKYFPDTPWWINKNDRTQLIEALSSAYAGDKASFETTHPNTDGGSINVLFSATPITLESGIYISVIGVDITQRKIAEEALRVSEHQFRNFFEKNSSVMLLVEPVSGIIVAANMAAETYYGYLIENMIGMNISNINILPPERIAEERQLALHGERNYFMFTHKLASGELRNIEAHSTPMESGGRILLFTIVHDITERKRAEQAFIESEYRWKFAIEGSGEGLWDWNVVESTVFFSKRWKAMLGYDEDDIGNDLNEWEKRVHPDDLATTIACVQKHLHGSASTYVNEHRVLCKDGSYKWILDRGIVVARDDDGKALRMIGTHTDITERKLSENELRIAAKAFESQEGILVTDANMAILRVNRAFSSITGYSAEEVIGSNPQVLSSGRHDAAFYEEMWKAINDKGEWTGEIWNKRKNGDIYPEHLTITVVKNDEGDITNYVASLADVTLSKAAAEEIQQLAFYDPLTQLPNRRLLIDRLKQALVGSARSGWEGALLFLDLDHFKTLNDTLGHDYGDLLLQQVAVRLTECVREGDTVARMGGDEFVLLLEGLSERPFEAAAQTKVIGDKILESLNRAYQLASHKHYSTPSIGATLFNNHQSGIEELLKQADIAMYQAKSEGRNGLRFFDQKMQDVINVRASIEIDLRHALEQQQFKLYYQIQVDSSEQPIGAEALIRWLHPERGLVSPYDFIMLAEETGLIVPIGQWVLETACAQLKAWERDEPTYDLTISINVSAKQFRQADFVTQVQSALERYDINPMLLKLELTESILLESIEETIATMSALKELGIRFSLDDFGTGYSSLQYLKQLPLYQLKIDRSFVRDIAIDSSDQAIVRTIIAMSNSLDLNVIAEGVETELQRQFLESNGCKTYQGYLFGKPVPIEQFEALLTNYGA